MPLGTQQLLLHPAEALQNLRSGRQVGGPCKPMDEVRGSW